jgi:hypothetical protein
VTAWAGLINTIQYLINLPHFDPTNTGQPACAILILISPLRSILYQKAAQPWNGQIECSQNQIIQSQITSVLGAVVAVIVW